MRDKEWLANLKVGDEVVYCTGYYGKHLSKVTRLTPTQIVVGDSKFWRKDGDAVGSSKEWQATYIVEPTEALKTEIRKAFLVSKLREIQWAKIGIDALEEIYAKAKNGQHVK